MRGTQIFGSIRTSTTRAVYWKAHGSTRWRHCASRGISYSRPTGYTVAFQDARLRDVEGLVKLVDCTEIEAHEWSLTPGRYVGVAPVEEYVSFDFEKALRSIHIDLKELNEEASEYAERIARNFEELGI